LTVLYIRAGAAAPSPNPSLKGGETMANKKQTSKPVAQKASKILRDDRFSKDSKSVAGSALSQTKKGKGK